MRFIDQARIVVGSGKGGAGCVSFRREKFIPKGGPDGGDGGDGGSIILIADPGLLTLYDFTHHRVFRAPKGRPGQGKQMTGAKGRDLLIKVPAGTLIHDDDTGELLADLVHTGQQYVAARGGQGGKGNKHFATSRNRTPRFAQPGEPGEERRLRLELKLLADVALVGLPNAGKSTLVSRISAARPKIADYPFTTIAPNLGVVQSDDFEPYVIADIPGLIEGASRGAGLGYQFLRHVERTRLLVFLLDLTDDPAQALATLSAELEAYNPELARRERVIVLNKADLATEEVDPPEILPGISDQAFIISGLTAQGVEDLTAHLAVRLAKLFYDQTDEDDRG